jgi:ribosomal protein S12 methylthiotransferase accessory factor
VLFANPRWLIAVAPTGLACVRLDVTLKIGLGRPLSRRRQLAEQMATGISVEDVMLIAGSTRERAEGFLAQLEQRGLLQAERPPPPPVGMPLADAVLALERHRTAPDRVFWTADEALIMPPDVAGEIAARAVRAFLCGVEPHARLLAYARATRESGKMTWGDVPERTRLERALEVADQGDPDLLHVVDLAAGSSESLPVNALDRVGARRPHRLGPIRRIESVAVGVRDLAASVARFAAPDARYVLDTDDRYGFGMAESRAEASTISRAEAIERYAAGHLAGARLVRASPEELPGAVPGSALFRLNRRQLAAGAREGHDPTTPCLWTPARALDSRASRWVPAEAVFYPFFDERWPGPRALRATSSGVAAHFDLAQARTHAFCELVERDAFMWTWVQRVSRERVKRTGLPAGVSRRIEAVERDGLRVELVNLSLDTAPVVMCAAWGEATLHLGAACHRDPLVALEKAVWEAAASVASERALRGPDAPRRPREVRRISDHFHLHQDADLIAEDAFLFASPDTVEVREIPSPAEPIESLVEAVGPPLVVELSSSASSPFSVVRALVPGLVPISFGRDTEPLGMPRLAEPKRTLDGRRLGTRLDLEDAGPLTPHPFA